MISELRPYQTEAIDAIRESIRAGVRRLCVQAATGAGKTKIAAAIVDSALQRGNRTAFVVPAISLVDQTVESFWAEGIRDIGVIQASHGMTDWSRPVQVCSIQTLQARRQWPEAKTVIFDECHRLHDAHKRWLADEAWQQIPFIGLSATPWTKGLGKYFESLLVAATTSDLIAQGFLSPFRVFATGHPDLSKVHTVAGDFHEGELSQAMQGGELTADIVRTWQDKWGKGKTLCFAVDKAHAQSIQDRFKQAGIACGYQDAESSPEERREVKKRFHNGEYPVVVNIQTLTTGVDWDVRCLILARPTRSEMLYVQIIGRALRTAPGKDCAIVLDHSETTQRLGFVTDIHHDSLDDGKPKPKGAQQDRKPPALPKECKQCAHLKPPRIKACPNCGFEERRESQVMERDGELVEVTGGGKKQRAKQKRPEDFTEGDRCTFFLELRAYGLLHEYKPGWAAIKYRERFDGWPPRQWSSLPLPAAVSAITSSWIRSRNIAWAKSRQNADVHA